MVIYYKGRFIDIKYKGLTPFIKYMMNGGNTGGGDEPQPPVEDLSITWEMYGINSDGSENTNNSNERRTNYIPVSTSNTYKLTDNNHSVGTYLCCYAYDSNKTFISRFGGNSGNYISNATDYILDLPENTAYIRFRITITSGSYTPEDLTSMPKITLNSSSGSESGGNTPVQSINIENSRTLDIGDSFTLNAVISPSNASNKNVTWSIDNNNCVITANGLSCNVTARTAGTSVVTVTTADGNHTATCTITVLAATAHVSSITLNKTSASVNKDSSLMLSAILTPASVVNSNVIWSINNSTVASITSNGLNATIKGLTVGSVVVTCTAEDTENGTISATCNISVVEASTDYAFATAFTVPSATNIYEVPLSTYNISNNGTNANATTTGINSALRYAKNNGYDGVKLPAGEYLIDTNVTNPKVIADNWSHDRPGICMPSNMELILDGCTLRQTSGTEEPMTIMISIMGEDNVKISGGTIIGDRYTHNYGIRINESGTEFERGSLNSSGNPIDNNDCVRSKHFITNFPSSEFTVVPLWNTIRNTVDCWGSTIYVYFYNNSNTLVGTADTKFVTGSYITPPSGATKMKLVLREENNLDACVAMTTRTMWASYEFGSAVCIGEANNIELNGCTIRDCTGDCVMTYPMPVGSGTHNFKIVNCDLSNARRQGISYTNIGSNFHVINCNIHDINGVDPQCGIDFEVGASNVNEMPGRIIVEGCNFYGNKKWDIVNYDGINVEIRNCTFDSTLGTTYGYNMDIHDNTFISKEHYPHPKHSYPEFMWLFMWDGVANDKYNPANAFFKVYNNTFEGYNAGFMNTVTLNNPENTFSNNVFRNCGNVKVYSAEPNTFENCTIDYMLNDGTNVSGSTFTNCTIYTDNAHNITFNGSTLTNCNNVVETSTSTTVSSISMPSTMTIQQGETKLLKPMILPTSAFMDGEPLTHQLWFESSDYDKVFVSEAGYVTAIGDPEGVVITCRHRNLPDGSSVNVSATCTLTTGLTVTSH